MSSENRTAVLTEHILTGTQGGFITSELAKARTQGRLGRDPVQALYAFLMKKPLLITSLLGKNHNNFPFLGSQESPHKLSYFS